MNDQNEITILLENVRDSIKEYLDGDLPLPEARDRFTSCMRRYQSLRRALPAAQTGEYLRGLFYQHNINNFTKFTAVLQMDANGAEHIVYYGEKSLIAEVTGTAVRISGNLAEKKVEKIQMSDDDDMPLYLYAYKYTRDKGAVLFVAATSSLYSNPDYFCFLCECVSTLIEIKDSQNKCILFNFSTNLSQEIIDYMDSRADESGIIVCAYFFKDFRKIISAFDMTLIKDAAAQIAETFKKQLPENFRVVTVSHSVFLSLCGKKDYELNLQKLSKLTFVVQGMIIPFEMYNFKIDSAAYAYDLIEEIYRLKNEFFPTYNQDNP